MNEETSYVLCVIIEDNKILLQHRLSEPNAGKWNSPGGKVKPWETFEEACVREVYEETSLKIMHPKHVSTIIYKQLGSVARIAVFTVRTFSGKPVSSSEGEVRWVRIEHLTNLKHNLAANLDWFVELALQSELPPLELVY